MQKFVYLFSALFLSGLIISGCGRGRKSDKEVVDLSDIDLSDPKMRVRPGDTTGVGLPIFYNMYLSVDMTTMFEAAGASFNDDLLHSPDWAAEYNTSSKKALNLGVYAVNLSYCKVFEQFETAGRYFSAMQRMAEELGIPSDQFLNTAKRFDRNITDRDSLIIIANEVYMTADMHLKENEQYSAAAQIILGGWVEAMHIAFDVAMVSKDIDILERVSEQRHSLDNLIDMLSDYKDDPVVGDFLKKLNDLRVRFAMFEVRPDSSFDPDTPAGKKQIADYLSKIAGLQQKIEQLRKEIVG